ncbi:MAG: hypothetical protein QT08_C0009G0009 [archaeon GW2011_AR17]|nr:MAG: hypothetical protein QT08_C0009G0009 [archaeon GW2011_AR17]MBS3154199.1 hypothetical protein [Candidatus Woesearchaeota archaeon]HIH14763.1 hypothetical protein [Nanoarchaeota archaeon]HIH58685.1 hypothetical protein [Nanoarchaeota archaeon]HII14473.1 hypothetical protein [Nanoarchaeota archaeon]
MERYFAPGSILQYGRKLGSAHERAPVLIENEILIGLAISRDIHSLHPLDMISITASDLCVESAYIRSFQKLQEGEILSLELYALPKKDIESCPEGSALTLRSLLDLVTDLSHRISSL